MQRHFPLCGCGNGTARCLALLRTRVPVMVISDPRDRHLGAAE